MKLAKRIGITQRVDESEKRSRRDCLEQDYIHYYEPFGINLVPIPNTLGNVEGWLEGMRLDGIILSGGNDINPRLFGGKTEEGKLYADERDKTEKQILDFAADKKIPVLAECRGTQFLNVHFGGTLAKMPGHVVPEHEVALLDKRLGRKNTKVNSFHSYCFTEKEFSGKLKTFARSKDGVIEGVFHPDLPIAGVMWHPERKSPDEKTNALIVRAFLERKWWWQ